MRYLSPLFCSLLRSSRSKRLVPYSPMSVSHSSAKPPFSPTMSSVFIDNIRQLSVKLLSALWVLKCEGIIHGDLKPENIFFSFSTITSPTASSNPPSQSFQHREISQNIPQKCLDLGAAPASKIDFILGDLGNCFLLSESMKFYRDFNLQSLPYRSPEVLCGIPFNHQIDLWSLGIILLEVCLGRTLFSCQTREELFLAHCHLLTPPQATRFAGGRYSRDLFALVESQGASRSPSPSPHNGNGNSFFASAATFADHHRTIYDLLLSPYLNSSCPSPSSAAASSSSSLATMFPSDLIHLIASLLYPDPDLRLNIQDALQHSFVSSFLKIPMTLWSSSNSSHGPSHSKLKGRKRKHGASVETLRTASQLQHEVLSNGSGYSRSAEMKEEQVQEEETSWS
jgi:serine/threonine protein kinase